MSGKILFVSDNLCLDCKPGKVLGITFLATHFSIAMTWQDLGHSCKERKDVNYIVTSCFKQEDSTRSSKSTTNETYFELTGLGPGTKVLFSIKALCCGQVGPSTHKFHSTREWEELTTIEH